MNTTADSATSDLALFGGPKAVGDLPEDLFRWPIVTDEDREAVLDVLNRGAMSRLDVTEQFEREFASWQGSRHALGFPNGTAALQAAMYAVGVRKGDEVICQSMTYWASVLPCYSLGATPVLADVEADSLCICPEDFERRITRKTRAVVVVHYMSHPADMDRIMEVARRHNVAVIEDTSHAQGALYKGRKVGTFGTVAACSIMSEKSLACGEGGMLNTDDQAVYDWALAFGHHNRFKPDIATEALRPYAGLPMGGIKGRMHQMTSAVGRVQLRHYDARCAEIHKAMELFWERLAGVPGLRRHWPKYPDSTKGGYYAARCHYVPEEVGGLSAARVVEALAAEGVSSGVGCNRALDRHPLFQTVDVYGDGKPTRLAHADRDVRETEEDLPNTRRAGTRVLRLPPFKKFYPEVVVQHAEAFRKVMSGYQALLADDTHDSESRGSWGLSRV